MYKMTCQMDDMANMCHVWSCVD